MRRLTVPFVVYLTFCMITLCLASDQPRYQDRTASIDERVEDLLARMSLEEKILMLSGDSTQFDTRPNPRLGIPALHMTDGPVGVRSPGQTSTAFPASICMASTWDTELIYQLGQFIGSEARAKGRNVLLAPCVNIHRVPHGGRDFESFGEDPYLAGRIAANYVKGVQSEKVIATVKHFACNNQELDRFNIDVKIDERTLHEIYLPVFKAAIQEGGAWAVMSAYNRLNGQYCSANTQLLTDILKRQWGFSGFVMSDWGAVHSCVPELFAGMDLEMPTTEYFKPDAVKEAVQKRVISPVQIDDKIRRMLRAMFTLGYFDQTEMAPGECDTPAHRDIACQVAQEGIVLLKNQNNLLPIGNQIQSIAVIGSNAVKLAYGGGGSSRVAPGHTVSPLVALTAKVGKNCAVRFESGAFLEDEFSVIPADYLVPPRVRAERQGLLGSYYDNPKLAGEPSKQQIDPQIDFSWQWAGPEGLKADFFSVVWEGQLRAPTTGLYAIGIGSDDGARLYIDGKLVIDNWERHGWGLSYKYATVQLEQGKPIDLKIEYCEIWGMASVRLVWQKIEQSPLKKAVALAKSSDLAILFFGSTLLDDTEGWDRKDLELPPAQQEIILAVAAVNPKTVVVLTGGAGIEMSNWLDKVPALLFAWFPGQEGGDAIADILLGNVNPSGKLATTFFKHWEDCAAYGNYPGKNGEVHYAEGVFVGYRHFDAQNIEPNFPFGYGMSYTHFDYKNLTIDKKKLKPGEPVTVSFIVKNSGDCDGAEVAQLYLGDEKASVPRPLKELKGFQRCFLKAGEEQKITLTIQPHDLQFFDACSHDWRTEPGKFKVYVGSSSREIRLEGSFVLQ